MTQPLDTKKESLESIEQQFATLLESLPSEKVSKFATTDDLKEELRKVRFHLHLVSKAWQARIQGDNDPIAQMVREKKLDPLVARHIWVSVDFNFCLWELCQALEPSVALFHEIFCIEYPFAKKGKQSAAALFKEILKDNADSRFRMQIQPYFEFGTTTFLNVCKIANKMSKGKAKAHEESTLIKFLGRLNYTNPWYFILMDVAEVHARLNDSRVIRLRRNLLDISDERGEILRTLVRKRNNSTWTKVKSFAWVNGEKRFANKTGGTYT